MALPVILTQGLTKHYAAVQAISDLDLRIEAAEIFGYLGPNGAGKTTTIRLLLDFIRPSAGRAEILGRDCQAQGRAVRRMVGYLPGEFGLYDRLSGQEVLAYYAALRGGVDPAFGIQLASRLDADLTRPARDLSHGNKQKLGLIQAFMHRPALLVLDEPTIGLDPLAQQQVYALLGEMKDAGSTVFLSSHNLPEVERICDRVGIIRDGRLVAVETVSELKQRSLRKIEVTFASAVPPGILSGLDDVHDVQCEGNRFTCTVGTGMAGLLKRVSAYPLTDLISREASLEEIFMAHYGDAGDVS